MEAVTQGFGKIGRETGLLSLTEDVIKGRQIMRAIIQERCFVGSQVG